MFENIYQNKKVLVTGHTGFKGSWLANWLISMGAEVTGLSKDIPTTPSLFEVTRLAERLDHHILDVRHLEKVSSLIDSLKPDFVFHLAAQPIVKISYDDPIETFTTNTIGTANILESLRRSNQQCIAVMITSDKCYENVEWTWGYRENDPVGGKDPYSASKGAAELVIHAFYHSYFKLPQSNISVSSVRAGNVIGGGDWAANRIVPDCIKAWSGQKPVEIRSPKATRPWQHVLEPLGGYLRTGEMLAKNPELSGESFNFGPNADQDFTVLELLEGISGHWDFGGQSDRFIVNQNSTFHEAGLLKLNCDKALNKLKWSPVLRFDQTVKFTAEWYNLFYHDNKADMAAFTGQQILDYVSYASKNGHLWAMEPSKV